MLLKAVGQLLGAAKRGWKAAGKCSNTRCRPIGEEADCLAAICKKVAITAHFFRSSAFLFILIKIKGTLKIFQNPQRFLSYLFSITSYYF
jgi:hypothetical protein